MLYLITNRKIIKSGALFSVIEKAVNGGIDAVILREKDLTDEELLPIAVRLQEIVRNKQVLFIVNNNLKVAKAVNADGYHTSFHNFINKQEVFNNRIGVSVHSLEEAILAEKRGAGYLLASHIFDTDCKKDLKPKGIQLIKDIKACVNIPVIALGGINSANIEQVFSAGADGIAVMSAIMQSYDPFRAAKELKDKINSYLKKV